MNGARTHVPAIALVLVLVTAACSLPDYLPPPIDATFRRPVGTLSPPGANTTVPSPLPQAEASLALSEVLQSVTERYPPWLSTLFERDLASGRLLSAMGNFDTQIAAKLGGQIQGYYDATTFEAMLEQPLTTGDLIYGGYRVSDGLLPDYDKARTQDNGEFVVGGRLPLLRDRAIDRRRTAVRQAQIDVELADPTIARARIDFVRIAARTYWAWVAAGQRVQVTKQLLRLATERTDAIRRGVELQAIAAIDVEDNRRLIAQREVNVARAERALQKAALDLSLFLRDGEDRPIVPENRRLPERLPSPKDPGLSPLDGDTVVALKQRPELRRFQLLIDRVEVDRRLAENQTLPNLDLVVEGARSASENPYVDPDRTELFVGGELKLPAQRRDARGRVEQATAQLSRLRLEEQFGRDRVINEVADIRSAIEAAFRQLTGVREAVRLGGELVTAEKRAFDVGRSDLLRIQLREQQLAESQLLEIDTLLDFWSAQADYRAALGSDGVPPP
jgi:outer membrane protein TolC